MQVKCTEADVQEAVNGGCTACGAIQYGGVEPDAREYICESCGAMKVYGLEELAMMGQLELTEGADADS